MNAPLDLLPRHAPRPVPPAMLAELHLRFGPRCSTAQAVRDQHGRDESAYPAAPPEVVVFCESNQDVAAVLRLAHDHAVPVIPFGVGSSLEGHLLAVQGGVSVDLSRMQQVLRVNAEDLTATVLKTRTAKRRAAKLGPVFSH
jgi:D-lactate dehydrogenase (cytochrome)